MLLFALAGCLFVSDADIASALDGDGDGLKGAVHGGPDCDDADPLVALGPETFQDADGDGAGDPLVSAHPCAPIEGWVGAGDDCDDTDPDAFPGNDETCDGRDEDCDGTVDDDPSDPTVTSYADADGDGHGDPDAPLVACDVPDGYVATADDCDDTDASAFEMCLNHEDADGDGYGNPDAYVYACTYLDGIYTSVSGDCDDTDAATNPGAFEESNSPTDMDCDGVIGDARLDQVGTMLFGEYAGSKTGPAVSIGDVVGGGEDDAMVGFPFREGGGGFALVEGSASVADPGDLSVIRLEEARSWWRSGDGEEGGAAFAAADYSGDGTRDLATGAPGTDGEAGAVYIFQTGVPAGELVPDLTFTGEADTDRAGEVLAEGDFDGDSNRDLAIAAIGAGKVYLLRGPFDRSGDLSVAVSDGGSRFIGPLGGDPAAGSALVLGDLDGDGADELAIGAPGFDDATIDAGAAWVCHGGADGQYTLDGDCDRVTGNQRGDAFGSALAVVDLDGDGKADLTVGAPDADGDNADVGAIYTFMGAAPGPFVLPAGAGEAELILYGEEGDEGGGRAGAALAAPGDTNGNGRDDLVVGAPGWTDPIEGPHVGAVYFLLPRIASGTRDLSTADDRYLCMYPSSTGSGCATGDTLAPAGDFDGDGLADTHVGAPGWLFDGSVEVGATAVVFGAVVR
ncbi:MAG: MopE-related protein [Pseudomonadota bacterium]|nr:MopE-related protein [Pseudomonadota bacterium]